MAGLQIVRSNRSERLALRLAEYLRANPLPDPIAADAVVVHSQGMSRWLSMVLSQEIGVCANVEFPFPAKVFRMAMARALEALDGRDGEATRGGQDGGAAADGDPWDPDRVTWVLLQVLPGLRDRLDPAMQAYLEEAADGTVRRKEYQLARRLANLFDDYANFRPEWIADWDRGEGIRVRGQRVAPDAPGGKDDWQARLWRAVVGSIRTPHPTGRIDDAIRALSDLSLPIEGLPPRLCLFGISTLPPSFVRVLVALSARIDVRLYALSPSHRYFGDMLTDEEAARNLARHIDSRPEDLHHYGHPLLKSLGRLGRDFHLLLTQAEEAAAGGPEGDSPPVIEDYEDPGVGGSMLATLQSDLLNLRQRRPVGGGDEGREGTSDGDEAPVPLEAPDGSIRFLACHGALRQVEVLRDEVLRLLKADPTLQARDVVVMSPDIDSFAPLIDAVFSDGEPDARNARQGAGFPAIDFRIADRSARQTNVVAEVVSRVLGLSAGRFPVSDVLDLLSLDPVRRRFGLDARDLESVHSWVAASGTRWGLDERHRRSQAQPEDRRNTWRFGLDRLLLGCAMPGDGQRTFADVLPFDDVEGGAARRLGRFVRFCETLFDTVAEIQGTDDPAAFQPGGLARKPSEWEALARGLVEAFVDLPGSEYWRVRKTLDVFRNLSRNAGAAGFDRGMDLDTVRAVIDQQMAESSSSAALLAGGVNFCALVPMRTIPFQVVCLLGMDDGGFPRQQRRMGFDLLGRHPATGDRSPRDDDRHLFLEALLAARKNLIVTWNGRSLRDNADLPPAVPVGELLDVLADSFDLPGRDFEERRRDLVAKLPLQAFGIESFRHDGRRSFDRRAKAGAVQLLKARQPVPAFFTAELPDPPEAERVVSVDDLVRFFQNPVRQLLQKRLAVRLDEHADETGDREPIALTGLEDWAVGDEVLRALLAGQDPGAVRRRIRLQGTVPLGVPGDLLLDRIRTEAGKVFDSAAPLRGGSRRTVDASLDVPGLSIRGTLDDVWASGQVIAQYGSVRARHVLGAWLRHLLACACDPGFPGVTTLVGRRGRSSDWGDVVAFRGAGGGEGDLPAHARERLANLADLYRFGWRRPLLLFPESSCAYTRAFLGPRPGADPDASGRRAALGQWQTGEGDEFPKEDADPCLQRVLQGEDPWDPGFDLPGLPTPGGFRPEELALRVWRPILAATAGGSEVPG